MHPYCSRHHLLFVSLAHLLPLLVDLPHSLPGPLAAEALAYIIVIPMLIIRVVFIIAEA